jgi:hypothetical protein
MRSRCSANFRTSETAAADQRSMRHPAYHSASDLSLSFSRTATFPRTAGFLSPCISLLQSAQWRPRGSLATHCGAPRSLQQRRACAVQEASRAESAIGRPRALHRPGGHWHRGRSRHSALRAWQRRRGGPSRRVPRRATGTSTSRSPARSE